MSGPSEATLISRTLELSDTDAFAELVRRHQARILMLQRRLCGEAALAEDMSQETFLRAWQKLGTYSATGSFGGWLARIGYNVFLEHQRRHRPERRALPLEGPIAGSTEPDHAALADLDRLLDGLGSTDQVLLILCYAWGLSSTEAGRVVDMPAGTVKARIHRAKRRIRDRLEAGTGPAHTDHGNRGTDASITSTHLNGASRR